MNSNCFSNTYSFHLNSHSAKTRTCHFDVRSKPVQKIKCIHYLHYYMCLYACVSNSCDLHHRNAWRVKVKWNVDDKQFISSIWLAWLRIRAELPTITFVCLSFLSNVFILHRHLRQQLQLLLLPLICPLYHDSTLLHNNGWVWELSYRKIATYSSPVLLLFTVAVRWLFIRHY